MVHVDGTAAFYADREMNGFDLATLLRYNADDLDPASCQHTEARMALQKTCRVCGAVAPRRGWKLP